MHIEREIYSGVLSVQCSYSMNPHTIQYSIIIQKQRNIPRFFLSRVYSLQWMRELCALSGGRMWKYIDSLDRVFSAFWFPHLLWKSWKYRLLLTQMYGIKNSKVEDTFSELFFPILQNVSYCSRCSWHYRHKFFILRMLINFSLSLVTQVTR
jgi:hypothetical protein